MTNIHFLQTSGGDGGHPVAPTIHLTPRQLEVLKLLCTGKPNKVIGRALGIASATVKVHVSCILRMLKVDSRLQAVLKAYELGLVSRDYEGGDRGGDSSCPVPMRLTPSPIKPASGAGAPLFAQAAVGAE